MGHMLERSPGNIDSTLNAHGNARTFQTSAYVDVVEANGYESIPTEEMGVNAKTCNRNGDEKDGAW